MSSTVRIWISASDAMYKYHGIAGKDMTLDLYKEFVKLFSEEAETGTVHHGTYGQPQALKLESDGPMTHIIEF